MLEDVLHIPTLAACFGETSEPVWVIDREGRIRFANSAAAHLGAGLGRTLERARRAVLERGTELDIALDTELDTELDIELDTELDIALDIALARGDSAGALGALRARPMRRPDGAIVAVRVVGERARCFDAGPSEGPPDARLRRALEHAPAPVALLRGPDHVYELVNARFCELIPGALSLVGTSARAHRRDLVSEHFVELLDHVWRTRERYESIEVPRVVDRDGVAETAYLTFVYQPMLRDDGEVDGIASVAFDVTESVLARKQVEEASRAKDEFLSTLSHELRTPLNAIVGWSRLLRTGAVQGTQTQRALEAIDRNAQLQKRLVDDLLDFSRMVTGELDVHPGVVDLTEIVASALEAIRPAVTAKRVELARPLDEPPSARAIVHGDADRLRQLVSNLLSNAAKFTGPGGRIEVSVAARGERVELDVCDDGVGIGPSALPHVFSQFRHAGGTTFRRHGGLGLGLAISRAIVELHGGEIALASDGIGRGTRVRVSLPRAMGVVARASPREAGPGGASPLLSGVRVLVVDDDQDARSIAEAALRRAGAEVRLASCALSAIELLHDGEVDVVVSDLGMPELDGITLIERVRAMPPPACHIAAVALTGYASAEDRERAVDAGYDAFLPKPLDVDVLAGTVAQVAGVARTGA